QTKIWVLALLIMYAYTGVCEELWLEPIWLGFLVVCSLVYIPNYPKPTHANGREGHQTFSEAPLTRGAAIPSKTPVLRLIISRRKIPWLRYKTKIYIYIY
ncbi:unnamed protein product, partial [Laminaria digitata]